MTSAWTVCWSDCFLYSEPIPPPSHLATHLSLYKRPIQHYFAESTAATRLASRWATTWRTEARLTCAANGRRRPATSSHFRPISVLSAPHRPHPPVPSRPWACLKHVDAQQGLHHELANAVPRHVDGVHTANRVRKLVSPRQGIQRRRRRRGLHSAVRQHLTAVSSHQQFRLPVKRHHVRHEPAHWEIIAIRLVQRRRCVQAGAHDVAMCRTQPSWSRTDARPRPPAPTHACHAR